MQQLCDKAINFLQMRNVDYGDIRLVRRRTQQIETKNGSVQSVTYEEDIGFGIRVLVDGAWGFAASNRMSVDEITRVADEAIEIVHPVKNLRFTQSILDAFSSAVALTKGHRRVIGLGGAYVVPGMKCESFTFTGKTEF